MDFRIELGAKYQFALINDDGRTEIVPVVGFVFRPDDAALCSMPVDVITATGVDWDAPNCYRALILPDGRALDLFGEEYASLDAYMRHCGVTKAEPATNVRQLKRSAR